MIYTESQMLQKLNQFIISFEDEIVEFKTAEEGVTIPVIYLKGRDR